MTNHATVQRFDRDLIPIKPVQRHDRDLARGIVPGDTRKPARFKRTDAIRPVLAAVRRLSASIDALGELVKARRRADAEAAERKEAEARHRELQRMVDEAGARVMRGEVRPTPSAAFRAHIFGGSK
jgi:hypothetical protein